MDIVKAEVKPSERGPGEWFTGVVWLDEIVSTGHSSSLRVHRVTFEPGARTAWHTHPIGQVLHVLSGIGRVQQAGKAVQTVRPGDTIHIAPDEKHWHGAAPNRVFVHLALQEAEEDGTEATWLNHVSDAEYFSNNNP